MIGRARMGLTIERGNLRRSLGLSTKSLVHHLKDHPVPLSDLPGFEKNHAKEGQYSKFLKGPGYVGLALDGVQSAAKVHQACTVGTEQECTKSKFSEGGRFAGSVIGGAAGGFLVSHLTCTVVFELPSGGTSLRWCGIVVGGAGGIFAGLIGSDLAQGKSELLYESYYR